MENQWTSTWVGASWAMLAQNDTFLKRSWRKMTERIDFSLIFRTILGYQNHTKIDGKNEVIFRRPKKLCFLRKKVPKAPKWRSKRHRNQAFSGIWPNYRIVLPPARGASFRGLKGSQIAFFFGTIFVSPLHAALEPLFFRFVIKMMPQRVSRIVPKSFLKWRHKQSEQTL